MAGHPGLAPVTRPPAVVDAIHHSVTTPCDTLLVPGPDPSGSRPQLSLLQGGGCPVVEVDEREDADLLRLAGEIILLLAAAPDGEPARTHVALPFGLSACMARHCLDPEGLIEAMLPLRRALIAASRLDAASEPVPLTAGEPKDAALALAAYLHGLLTRASAASDVHRGALASVVAKQLRSA